MRVLLVTGSYPPDKCGVGDYTHHLAKALSLLPEIHVGVLTSVSSAGAPQNTAIAFFPLIAAWRLKELLILARVIWRWAPHIVHVQYPTQGYVHSLLPSLLPIAAFMMGKKVVQTWHEGYSRRDAHWLFLRTIVPGGIIATRPQYIATRPQYKEGFSPSLHRVALWGKKRTQIPIASNIPPIALSPLEADTLRSQYLKGQKRLLVFFGFVYPQKGVEQLFVIADPSTDQIVIAGEIRENDPYGQEIIRCASTAVWQGKTDILGFLPSSDIAALLAIADAILLPFKEGSDIGNGSLLAGQVSGTFILTTSNTQNGYDAQQNVYYARPNNIGEMRDALNTYAGRRHPPSEDAHEDVWKPIAEQHHAFYKAVLKVETP